ncbi:unnamed protein product [Phytophthora fragariaefolia]|uniref:Unnamed protein product n=1 Tax=Phytophthora fragariaefolia TaxID=1490495 RepID=A0A9W6XXS8_9STRA|nr:unnamed protein product [Phytophthora fragariaefolia]
MSTPTTQAASTPGASAAGDIVVASSATTGSSPTSTSVVTSTVTTPSSPKRTMSLGDYNKTGRWRRRRRGNLAFNTCGSEYRSVVHPGHDYHAGLCGGTSNSVRSSRHGLWSLRLLVRDRLTIPVPIGLNRTSMIKATLQEDGGLQHT